MRTFDPPRYRSPVSSEGEGPISGTAAVPILAFEVLRNLIGRLAVYRSLSELLNEIACAAQSLLPGAQLAFLLRQPDATLEVVYCAPAQQEMTLRRHLDQLIDQGQVAQALKEGLAWVAIGPEPGGLLTRIATPRHIHGLILCSAPGLASPWQQVLGALADLTALGLEWLTGGAEVILRPPTSHLPPTPAFDLAVPIDRLTGLAHRVHFMRFIHQAILNTPPPDAVAILLLDIDGFHRVNHELGYEVGDRVLCELALRLDAALSSQTARACLGVRDHELCFARTGADEFGIAIAGLRSPQRLGELAAYLHSHIAEGFFHAGERLHLSVSIGIATSSGLGETACAHTLMRQADTALKRAKQSGRNRYALYEPGWQETGAHLRTESLLQEALRQDLFDLVLQPQFDLATGRLVGAEALLRLTLGEGGAIPPSCFIPVAESTGQIIEISQWMIRRICRQIRAWDARGLPQIPLSVNLSAVELSQPQLAEAILGLLVGERLEPHRLHLEITETAVARQESQALANLRALHAAGFAIWIDDFGTGYASLKAIKHYPASGIKLDREFVQDLNRDGVARAITRTILKLAKELGYPVVAEGIEDPDQYKLLRDWGCPIGQGYLLGRPVDTLEFERLYLALPG